LELGLFFAAAGIPSISLHKPTSTPVSAVVWSLTNDARRSLLSNDEAGE